jgi:hypothetical protein
MQAGDQLVATLQASNQSVAILQAANQLVATLQAAINRLQPYGQPTRPTYQRNAAQKTYIRKRRLIEGHAIALTPVCKHLCFLPHGGRRRRRCNGPWWGF